MPLEGFYGLYHIVYIIVSLIIMISALIITTIHPLSKKALFWTLKTLGAILLILLVINRYTVIKWYIEHGEPYRWIHVLPNTWCSFASMTLALTLLLTKKESIFYHFCVYLNIYGGAFVTFLPTFLNQGFYEVRTITGLVFHSLACFIAIFLFLQKYIHPSFIKSLAFPIGMIAIMLIGYFQKYVMGYPLAMQVREPFIDHGPSHFITAWYVVVPASSLLVITLNYLYELVIEHKTNDEIFHPKKYLTLNNTVETTEENKSK